jgi:Family of unknown function (DUF6624)
MIVVALALQSRAPCAGGSSSGAGKQSPARDESLRRELIRMAEEDETSGSCARTSPSDLLLCRDTGEVRHDNQLALDRIIAEHGWPGRTLVGVDGQRAAWLIAQHADDDVAFQKNCLDLIREAFVVGEAEGNALAYLTDRILEHEGSPQMYGTQGVGVFSPEDERRVDANRKAIGLEPWRQYFDKVKNRPKQDRIRIAPWAGL